MADRTRVAKQANPADLSVLTALRRAWTEMDAGGPVHDAATALMPLDAGGRAALAGTAGRP